MNAHIRLAAVLVGVLSLSSFGLVGQTTPTDAGPSTVLSVDQPRPDVSYAVGQVVKMWQAGVGGDLIATYVNSSTAPYRLDADGIIYVKSVGLPSELIQSMMQRDVQLQQAAPDVGEPVAVAPLPPAVVSDPAPSADSKVVIIGSDPPPPSVQVTVIGSGYPGYNYYYPYRDTFCASGATVLESACIGGVSWRAFR